MKYERCTISCIKRDQHDIILIIQQIKFLEIPPASLVLHGTAQKAPHALQQVALRRRRGKGPSTGETILVTACISNFKSTPPAIPCDTPEIGKNEAAISSLRQRQRQIRKREREREKYKDCLYLDTDGVYGDKKNSKQNF